MARHLEVKGQKFSRLKRSHHSFLLTRKEKRCFFLTPRCHLGNKGQQLVLKIKLIGFKHLDTDGLLNGPSGHRPRSRRPSVWCDWYYYFFLQSQTVQAKVSEVICLTCQIWDEDCLHPGVHCLIQKSIHCSTLLIFLKHLSCKYFLQKWIQCLHCCNT